MEDENGQYELIEYNSYTPVTKPEKKEKQKMKPRGASKAWLEFCGSDYPDFLQKVVQIGFSIKERTPEEMMRGLTEYLKLCQEFQKPISNQAAYMSMGINYKLAYAITHGITGTKEQKQIIEYAQQICTLYREGMALTGSADTILTLFWQKCYDGLNEMTEANSVGVNDQSMEEQTAEEIMERYNDLPD